MSCHHTRLMLAFRPDELAADDRAALAAHLNVCPACAKLSRAETAADAAIRTAMRAVPVPDGLRSKLHAMASAHQGAAWRQKVYRWGGVALAASLLVAVGVWQGPTLFRTPFDTTGFSNALDRDQLDKRQAVADWQKAEGLPELPADLDFEYAYHTIHGTTPVNGRNVPVVLFQNGPHQCRVYMFRKSQLDVPPNGLAATQGSEYKLKTVEQGEWLFVIAYTSETLDPFLKQKAPAV